MHLICTIRFNTISNRIFLFRLHELLRHNHYVHFDVVDLLDALYFIVKVVQKCPLCSAAAATTLGLFMRVDIVIFNSVTKKVSCNIIPIRFFL